MSLVEYWNDYTGLYKKVADTDPKYKKWVATLTDPTVRAPYWASLLDSRKIPAAKTVNTVNNSKPRPVYSDSIITDGKIGIMRITSFSLQRIEKDSALIMPFLEKIKDFDNLIIDIQNNGGGATRYWKKNIAEKLIKDTIYYPQYLIIKDGNLNKEFYPEYFENTTVVRKEGTLQNIPSELLDGTFRLKIDPDTISPNNPVPFKGKIYLLVNGVVFSSAEGFAYFCKATGWATIAGVRTGGDGVGSDPIPFILPESGIIIRYPALSGFNPDGSLNFEERTTPDILIDGKNADERLSNLIDYIRRKKY
jgi:C-terminal processing protease CtpA/Prc